jgi:predicted nucleic acid-binding protein
MLAVIDTNVLVSALRSAFGASNAVLRRLAMGDYGIAVSTALCLEYDDVLKRPGMAPGYSPQQIDVLLNSVCSVAEEAFIYFRWRLLPAPIRKTISSLNVPSPPGRHTSSPTTSPTSEALRPWAFPS